MKERLSDVSLQILDIREASELALALLINTTHLPMGDIPFQLEKLSKDKTWVVMCHTGQRSLMACDFLAKEGYSVLNLSGGIHAWSLEIDASVPIY